MLNSTGRVVLRAALAALPLPAPVRSLAMLALPRRALAMLALALLAVAVLAVTSVASATPAATAPPGNDSSTATGKKLFDTVGCWSCHGFDGQGAMSRGIASGPHINARVLPEAAFIHQLRTPIGVMPPYTADVLSDEQVRDIYHYLSSLPAPPALKDIPLLNQP
jgi:mono/diheme cytochrome c family protein